MRNILGFSALLLASLAKAQSPTESPETPNTLQETTPKPMPIAAKDQPPKNAIKFNGFALIWGNDLFSYERKIDHQSTIAVGVGLYSAMVKLVNIISYGASVVTSPISGHVNPRNESAYFGAQIQYRYYIKEAMQGFYIAPQVGFAHISNTVQDPINIVILGGRVGQQWIFSNQFSVDLHGGINMFYGPVTRLLPGVGFSMGFAF